MDNRGEWIRTRSGLKFHFEDPRPEEITITDIAYALAGINRFTAHTRYTVAQHCVMGSYHVPPGLAFEFLLHDAGEAYIGDINKPLKIVLGDSYRRIATKVDRAIRAKYDIPLEENPLVKEIDSRMCITESRDLMKDTGVEWSYYKDLNPLVEVQIIPWSPVVAELKFLERFEELYGNTK